ncbi:hypothetical protein RLOC_00007799 [Lonchura striata]|uniref:Uncharacterized protein n=1 Tax=Lonchura striata TaxID=40157 RepID=A0A218UY53_9PASE|nr:hypothetical protein RLOC_00007799 [Lonchura striata domestica]
MLGLVRALRIPSGRGQRGDRAAAAPSPRREQPVPGAG